MRFSVSIDINVIKFESERYMQTQRYYKWIINYECRMRLTCSSVQVVQTFSSGRLETVLLFGQEDRDQIDSTDMKYTAFLVHT